MLGFFIGAVSGAIQFFLLAKFTGFLTRGKISGKTVLFLITQFLLPFIVLLSCAFLGLVDELLFVGIGMAAALIICATVRFFIVSKSDKK